MKNQAMEISYSGRLSMEEKEGEEISKMGIISQYEAREEEIERKKMEMREKVEAQLGRAEEEAKRLGLVWEELQVLGDPLRKEVGMVRKRLDLTNRDLKSLGQTCQKKEKEYKEALDIFNEKNKEKAQMVNTLMELLTESERLRMMKLEEISKNIQKH